MIKQLTYSIVVPVFNSEYSIESFYCKLVSALTKLENGYEILFVNDCSIDNSLSELMKLASVDSSIRIINLHKNYGQNFATLCGYRLAKGDIVITIDDDGQYEPDDIIKLSQHLTAQQLTIVFGKSVNRAYATNKFLPIAAKWVFDNIILRSHRHKFYFSSFRAINKSLLKARNPYFIWEIPPSFIAHLDVNHYPRVNGQSNYNYLRLFRFFKSYILYAFNKTAAILAIVSVSIAGLIFSIDSTVGLTFSLIASGFIIIALFCYLKNNQINTTPLNYVELHLPQV